MICPKCPDTVLHISERKNIEIDFCPKCRGVWLDRGELDKILEKAAQEVSLSNQNQVSQTTQAPPAQAQHTYKSDARSDDYYKYKRKKSFFEEIFD